MTAVVGQMEKMKWLALVLDSVGMMEVLLIMTLQEFGQQLQTVIRLRAPQ